MRTTLNAAMGFLALLSIAAAPATKPADSDRLEAIEAKIAQLARQVEEISRQIASLRKQAAQAEPTKEKLVDVNEALRARMLAPGMTREQVEAVTQGGVGGKGEMQRKSAFGSTWRWQVSNRHNVFDDSDLGKTGSYFLVCDFDASGKLVAFRKMEATH